MKELKDFIEARTQAYAAGVISYIRQTDNEQDILAAVADLKARVATPDEVADAVWNEEIPDILTPTQGDTRKARTHLANMPTRVADVVEPENGATE